MIDLYLLLPLIHRWELKLITASSSVVSFKTAGGAFGAGSLSQKPVESILEVWCIGSNMQWVTLLESQSCISIRTIIFMFQIESMKLEVYWNRLVFISESYAAIYRLFHKLPFLCFLLLISQAGAATGSKTGLLQRALTGFPGLWAGTMQLCQNLTINSSSSYSEVVKSPPLSPPEKID